MNIIDLNLINEMITKMENDVYIQSSFTFEEKILATEQIINNYHDLKNKIPEIRQRMIEKN